MEGIVDVLEATTKSRVQSDCRGVAGSQFVVNKSCAVLPLQMVSGQRKLDPIDRKLTWAFSSLGSASKVASKSVRVAASSEGVASTGSFHELVG